MNRHQRLSATADRPRRHLRVIRGRSLAEQLAIAVVKLLDSHRAEIERDPANVRRVLLTLDIADGLVDRARLAIERAQTLTPTGTDG